VLRGTQLQPARQRLEPVWVLGAVHRRAQRLRLEAECREPVVLYGEPVRLLLHGRVEQEHPEDSHAEDEGQERGEGGVATTRRRRGPTCSHAPSSTLGPVRLMRQVRLEGTMTSCRDRREVTRRPGSRVVKMKGCPGR
jgi:hypothetical protein